MNNIDIKFNKSILFYLLLFFMISEPVILYTALTDEYLSTKALFCFAYSFILAFFIFACDYVKTINKKNSIFVPSLIIVSIVIINILSLIFSPYISKHTTSKIFNYLLFGKLGRNEGIFVWLVNFTFLLTGYFAVNSIKNVNIFFKVSILMADVVAFDGLLQFLFGKDILFLWAHQIKKYNYCFSLLGNQNFVGNFLALLMPISLGIYLVMENKNKYRLSIYYVSVILQFSCLLCSKTRGAWIGAGLSLILLSAVSIKFVNKNYYKKIIVVLIGFIAAFLIINHVSGGAIHARVASLAANTTSALSGDETSGTKRIFLWKHTLTYIKERPVLGWGTNSMPLFFKVSSETAFKNWGNPNIIIDKAHNEYLQIAATIGVPALILYISVLVFAFVYALRHFDKLCSLNRIPILMLITSIIGYSVSLFFNFSILTYSTWFFIIIGVLLKYPDIEGAKQLNGEVLIEKQRNTN